MPEARVVGNSNNQARQHGIVNRMNMACSWMK
jgi:hypothetical protein